MQKLFAAFPGAKVRFFSHIVYFLPILIDKRKLHSYGSVSTTFFCHLNICSLVRDQSHFSDLLFGVFFFHFFATSVLT